MLEEALTCLEEADTFAAVEFLNQQPDAKSVADTYFELAKDLYWRQKNIDQVVTMSRAGIQFCSDQAERAAGHNQDLYLFMRSRAKALAYNIASFTWPGWDEEGIRLSPQHVEAGYDSARMNLRLALELDKGDIPLSRAYWMLGAHLFTEGFLFGAAFLFERAALYARRANDSGEVLLNETYALLAGRLREPENTESAAAYEQAKERLLQAAYGPDLVAQVETAERVYRSKLG